MLAAVAVSIVPLAVFAIERLVGWWPLDDAQANYHQYYTYVQGGWLAMEAATRSSAAWLECTWAMRQPSWFCIST